MGLKPGKLGFHDWDFDYVLLDFWEMWFVGVSVYQLQEICVKK